MVRNEREYRISKAQVEKFELAVVELSDAGLVRWGTLYFYPRLLQAQRDSLQSQLTELREELAEYEEKQQL